MSNFNEVLARNAKNVAKSTLGFSHSVAFSHYNNFSAQLPVDAEGNIVGDNIVEQTVQCLKNIENIGKAVRHTINDVVKLTVFVKSEYYLDDVKEVIKNTFGTYKPALTLVVVRDIPRNALVQIEALFTCGEGTIPEAPQAGDLVKVARNTIIAPMNDYSTQSVAFSHYNHLSAQLPINPRTNEIEQTCVGMQTRQCLKNVKAILKSINVAFDDIVKVNIYTTELGEKEKILSALKAFFPDSAIARAVNYLPAVSINQVEALDLGAKVQVEVTVSHGAGTPPQLEEDRHNIVVKPSNTTGAIMTDYSSQSVAFSHYNNISEQFGISSWTNDFVSSDINEQFNQCIINLRNIVENIDHKLTDVVKLNIFVKDINAIDGFEEILKDYFDVLPAGRVIEVADLGHDDALVKIDAIVSNAEGTPPTR